MCLAGAPWFAPAQNHPRCLYIQLPGLPSLPGQVQSCGRKCPAWPGSQLFLVPSHHGQLAACQGQNLSHQQAQLPRRPALPPSARGPRVPAPRSSQAAARGSTKTATSSCISSGTGCKFFTGRQNASARAPFLPDPQSGAIGAVSGLSGSASGAVPARSVDLPNHPLANDGLACCYINDPYKLVARNARKTGITPYDFQVRVADSNQGGANASLPGRGLGRSSPSASLICLLPVGSWSNDYRSHYNPCPCGGSGAVAKELNIISVHRHARDAQWIFLRDPGVGFVHHPLNFDSHQVRHLDTENGQAR